MGISDAQKYLLFIKKFKNIQHKQTSTKCGEKAVFPINSVGKYDGGKYYCYYETTLGWSAHSDELELVVTGKGILRGTLLGSNFMRRGLLSGCPFLAAQPCLTRGGGFVSTFKTLFLSKESLTINPAYQSCPDLW